MLASTSRSARALLLGALLVLPGGCAVARMQMDPQLAARAPEQQVQGLAFAQFRKPVTFGPYTATLTRGGFTRNTTTQAGPYQRRGTQQSFDFTLDGAAPSTWTGACSFDASAQAVIVPVRDEVGFLCTLRPQGGGGWQLQLAREGQLYGPKSLGGAMTDGATTLSITMVRHFAGSSFAQNDAVGYELRDAAGAAVAAVQVIGPQFVWIDPNLPAELQGAIAAGAVGLLVSAGAARETT